MNLVENSTVGTSSLLSVLSAIKEAFESQEFSESILDSGLSVYKYYTPLICFLGILGNSLSITVFAKDSKYRKQSSSYYLSALAISDSFYLLNLFFVWLGSLTNGVITYNFVCPLVMYIGQLSTFVTHYLAMAFSMERYIAVCFPLKRRHICTVQKAKLTIIGILTIGLISFFYVWIVAEVRSYTTKSGQEYVCTVADRFHKISEIANYLDTLFVFVVPFFAIAYFNINIVRKVCQKGRRRPITFKPAKRNAALKALNPNKEIVLPVIHRRARDLLRTIQVPLAFVVGLNVTFHYDIQSCQRRKTPASGFSERRITKILLLISSVFLGLNLPLHVVRCVQFLQQSDVPTDELNLTLSLQPWTMMLFNTNFAINLVLYCLSGTKFRNSLREIFIRKEKQNSAPTQPRCILGKFR